MRGLYVGRFQPIHNGHLHCIKYALTKVEELIVVIAASQYSHTIKNPFTAGERYEMIFGSIKEAMLPIDKIHLIPAFDINDNSLWPYHLKRLVPSFEVAFSNNSFTTMLFEMAGVKVEHIPLLEREQYNATKIREKIITDEPLDKLVPKYVISFLKRINAKERIMNAINSLDDPRKR